MLCIQMYNAFKYLLEVELCKINVISSRTVVEDLIASSQHCCASSCDRHVTTSLQKKKALRLYYRGER